MVAGQAIRDARAAAASPLPMQSYWLQRGQHVAKDLQAAATVFGENLCVCPRTMVPRCGILLAVPHGQVDLAHRKPATIEEGPLRGDIWEDTKNVGHEARGACLQLAHDLQGTAHGGAHITMVCTWDVTHIAHHVARLDLCALQHQAHAHLEEASHVADWRFESEHSEVCGQYPTDESLNGPRYAEPDRECDVSPQAVGKFLHGFPIFSRIRAGRAHTTLKRACE
eukprot:CAMPEP_0117545490 /NCGR_PEP_ID=MMETSP0784-20121206/46120_1 /TAXON_ID=39447 /ORGANISM="" /LENGTH=224 /DNA_ID=CAMNT_0005342335 /DNA_START=67 /DNA_END=738 /DNA_ORIENTATION=-